MNETHLDTEENELKCKVNKINLVSLNSPALLAPFIKSFLYIQHILDHSCYMALKIKI